MHIDITPLLFLMTMGSNDYGNDYGVGNCKFLVVMTMGSANCNLKLLGLKWGGVCGILSSFFVMGLRRCAIE